MTSCSNSLRRARPLLGTFVEIGVPAGTGPQAVHDAFAAIERVQRLMSAQEPASELSRINRAPAGAVVPIDAWTERVLRRAQEISRATGGLFDCCAGAGTSRDLELIAGPAVRKRRALRVTLDGIAKGFAVDQAVAVLQAAGIEQGVVNAGGDLRAFGTSMEPVHVRDPGDPSLFILLGTLQNGALATSAQYVAGAADKAPIVDPRDRATSLSKASVSVIAPDCITADALTKVVLLDPDASAPLLRRLGARATVVQAGRHHNEVARCAAA